MAVDDAMDKAIRRLYAAATGDIEWSSVFDSMLAAAGFDGAALYLMDRAQAQLDERTDRLVMGLWHRLNPAPQSDYEQHYFKLDRRVQLYMANPNVGIVHDYMHTAEAEIDRDPYYAWYLRTQDTRYSVGGMSDPSLPFSAGVTLHRRAALGPVQPDELERVGVLFSHLERALLVEHRLFRASQFDSVPRDLLDSMTTGLVLLNRSGRLVHANAAAAAMARAGDAFTLGAEGLRCIGAQPNALLQRALGGALAANATAPPPPPLFLPRSSGARDYLVIASPVTSREGLFKPWAPAACVLIIDPARGPQPPAALLRQMFGLTAAETKLVLLLLADRTLADAAEMSAISLATVRSHLASVFRKTHTTRQAELVRLLATIPWPAVDPGRG